MPSTDAEAPLMELLDALPVGILILREGSVVFANPCLADWLGRPRESLAGLEPATAESAGLAGLFAPEDELRVPGPEQDICLRRRRIALSGGGEAQVFEDHAPLAAAIRERDHWRDRSEALNPLDPGTGLLNQAAIVRSLDREISRSRRYGNPLSVIHVTLAPAVEPAASAALGELARELKAELRWVDEIGRYDQGSLLVVLPETRPAAAEILSGKLGRVRACLRVPEGHTLEFRVAGWRTGDDSRKLLKRLERDTDPA